MTGRIGRAARRLGPLGMNLRSLPRRYVDVGATLAVGLLALASVLLGPDPKLLALGFALVMGLLAFSSLLLSWRGLLVLLCMVIMLVPARRFSLPIDLPYRLEPYRLVIIVILVGIIASLLVDSSFRLRRLGFGGLVAALIVTSLVSVAGNGSRIAEEQLDGKVLGSVLQLLTVALVFVIVRLLATSRRDIYVTLGVLVACGAFVAVAAAFERQTKVNIFRYFDSFSPFKEFAEDSPEALRGQGVRAFGSSQHPISLGVEMVMLVPIGAYLARHSPWPRGSGPRRAFWGGASVLLLLGMAASVSRTTVVTLAAVALVALCLRPRVVASVLPLAVPLLVAMLVLMPSALADLVTSLTPRTGLLGEQRQGAGGRGSGRLADLGPAMEDLAQRPFFGRGFGTRVTEEERRRHAILDNGYLTRAVDVGVAGLVALLALNFAPIRRMWRVARHEPDGHASPRGDLAAALAASFAAYAVSLFFYDGFIQPQLTFMILLAVAGWLLLDAAAWKRAPAVVRLTSWGPTRPLAVTGGAGDRDAVIGAITAGQGPPRAKAEH